MKTGLVEAVYEKSTEELRQKFHGVPNWSELPQKYKEIWGKMLEAACSCAPGSTSDDLARAMYWARVIEFPTNLDALRLKNSMESGVNPFDLEPEEWRSDLIRQAKIVQELRAA